MVRVGLQVGGRGVVEQFVDARADVESESGAPAAPVGAVARLRRAHASGPDVEAVLDRLPYAAAEVDAGGLPRSTSSAWRRMFGNGGQDSSWLQRLSPDGTLAAALALKGRVDVVLPQQVDGQDRWLRLRASAGSPPCLLVVDDITAQHRTGLVLSREESAEPLTGLLNRAALTRRLEKVVGPGASWCAAVRRS